MIMAMHNLLQGPGTATIACAIYDLNGIGLHVWGRSGGREEGCMMTSVDCRKKVSS